jgi:hypothetical protein
LLAGGSHSNYQPKQKDLPFNHRSVIVFDLDLQYPSTTIIPPPQKKKEEKKKKKDKGDDPDIDSNPTKKANKINISLTF